MASNSIIKIHEQCIVAPPPAATQSSLPLSFFDLMWLRIFPIEYVFSYALHSHDPSFFFQQLVPKLKTSLSLALQHFLPLAGNIVWPPHSAKPFVQFDPAAGDGVSLVIAESSADFKDILDNSPRDALEVRSLLPHLDSSDSHSAVVSLQITLFPNSGFTIGVSASHAVIDAKSLTAFIKAWASLCQVNESLSPSLVPDFEVPLFDRDVIKDPNDRAALYASAGGRSLKIEPYVQLKEEVDAVRATFVMTRADLEKVKKDVLSEWDSTSKPPINLSTFVAMSGYVLVCIAKAIHGVDNERRKFGFGISVDCRSRLQPLVPDNYTGNCISAHFVDAEPADFIKEDGVVIVTKSIHEKIKMVNEGVIKAADSGFARFSSLVSEGVEMMSVSGSNRFGMYGVDFGWGRPEKVEMLSVDRNILVALIESKDGNGVELGIVLNKRVMDLFTTLFHAGLRDD